MMELLAPAGDMEKLKTALHFGADAVYFAGKHFGLRAFSANFEDLSEPVKYCHERGKKAYVTVNIYARNFDIPALSKYLVHIEESGADGIIVSDIGIMELAKRVAPSLNIHVSTQANTTNYLACETFASHFGAKRIVLARELTFAEVSEICKNLKGKAEIEVFAHGAMCISYSGRCLLSSYLCNRDGNRGECVQACRWEYTLHEISRNKDFGIEEDEQGTYILNSKDLCLINRLAEIDSIGVSSIKIEGRMKSPYYVATVVNAYRRGLDLLEECKRLGKKFSAPQKLLRELEYASHREYTEGFMFDEKSHLQNYNTGGQTQSKNFVAVVLSVEKNGIWVEMRNRFHTGDVVEILSSGDVFGTSFTLPKMKDLDGETITDAKFVQKPVFIPISKSKILKNIQPLDILRR